MYDVLELLLKVKAEGLDSLDKAEGSVKNVSAATKAGSQEFRQFEGVLKALTGAGNSYREAIDQIAKGTSGAAQSIAKQVQAADKDFQTFQRNAEKFEQQQARSSERQAEIAARQADRAEREAVRLVAAAERRAAAEERATERIIRTLERRAAITSQVNREGELAQERAFALANVTNPAQAQRINTAFDAMNAANQRSLAARAARQAEEQAAQLERLGTTGLAYGAGLPMPWAIGRGAMSAGLVGPLIGIGAGVAAVSLVHSEAQSARETKDLSGRLDLPVGQTRDLQNEAKLAGVSVNVLESSVRTLSAALEDESGTGKKASEAISKLGIQTITSRGEVREMGPVLTEVIDKLSLIPSRTERAHEGTVILGRGYKELEPLIEKHRQLNAELDKFGLRSNSNLINTLDEAETKISAMGIAWDLFKSKLAVAIEPIAIRIVTSVTSLLTGPKNPDSRDGTPGPPALQRMFDASGRTDHPDLVRQIVSFADALNDPRLKSNVNSYSAFLGNQGDQADVLRGRVSKAKEDLDAEIKNGEKFKSTDVDNDARDKERKKIEELRSAYEKLNAQLTALEGHKRAQSDLANFLDTLDEKELGPVAKIYAKRDDLVKKGAVLTSADYARLNEGANAALDKERAASDKVNDHILDVGSKDAAKTGPASQLRAMGLIAGMPASQVNDEHFEEDLKKGLDRHAKDILDLVQQNASANRRIAGINFDEDRARTEDQSRHTLRNLEQGAPVGEIEQRNVIEESYRIRLDLAAKLKEKEDERNASETNDAKRREDEANTRFAYDKLVWQAEDEHEEKLLELEKRRADSARALSGKLFDALTGKGGAGKFLQGELTSVERTMFENVTSGLVKRGTDVLSNSIGGQVGPDGKPTALGKLLRGTPLESHTAAADPIKDNTAITKDNTSATRELSDTIRGAASRTSPQSTSEGNPLTKLTGHSWDWLAEAGTFGAVGAAAGYQLGGLRRPQPVTLPANAAQTHWTPPDVNRSFGIAGGLIGFGGDILAHTIASGGTGPWSERLPNGVSAINGKPRADVLDNSQATKDNTAATQKLTESVDKMSDVLTGGTGDPTFLSTGGSTSDVAGGFGIPGPLQTAVKSGSSLKGFLSGVGTGASAFAVEGAAALWAAMSGSPNMPTGPGSATPATAANRTGAIAAGAGAAIVGAEGVISGIKEGGGRGISAAIGSGLGTAAVFDPEPISKSILALGAVVSGLVGKMFGDPKADRQNYINQQLLDEQYVPPPTINRTVDTLGYNVAYDKLGHPYSTPGMGYSVSDPSTISFDGGYYNIPGSVTQNYSAPPPAAPAVAPAAPQITLIVHALDTQNILDRSRDIGQAVYHELQKGGALASQIQTTILGS